ncbi:MAG: hypothetical protein ACI802_003871, partial [Candidatus Paceibacteria bacterium]
LNNASCDHLLNFFRAIFSVRCWPYSDSFYDQLAGCAWRYRAHACALATGLNWRGFLIRARGHERLCPPYEINASYAVGRVGTGVSCPRVRIGDRAKLAVFSFRYGHHLHGPTIPDPVFRLANWQPVARAVPWFEMLQLLHQHRFEKVFIDFIEGLCHDRFRQWTS